eukprot:NODE_458_length_820_cov_560.927850_g449_i0.p1 GENE.NODE_458_length_820_cov_560.927850_g449_i0~~NODE_458_length_820_cov_560.927850_g449_i0.p1  ORF type:complete len:185 (+),score=58.12 NODE_458_length_820_cov_560.927850_g449_i0:78-632(+)
MEVKLPETTEVGAESIIKVTIPSGSGTGPLNVSVKATLTPKPLTVVDNGDGSMSVKFTPRANGNHEFTLKWGDTAIEGSPFQVTATGEAKRDPSKVKVDLDSTNLTTGKTSTFKVVAEDEAGPGPLMVDAEGPAEPTINLKNIAGGEFSVDLTCPKCGEYKVDIQWGEGAAVPGSPFTFTVKDE